VSKYRRHYFLRRSFATVREFAECLRDLQNTPEFSAIRSAASPENVKILDDAVRFFSTNAQTWLPLSTADGMRPSLQ
jgi:hypothetical protein